MAKKYHPDTVAADATPEQREQASLNFARINSAYQLCKDKIERIGDNYFAVMMGGSGVTYESRSSHIRQSFSHGYGYDDFGDMFSGQKIRRGPNADYSTRYGPMHNRKQQQTRPQSGNNRNYAYGYGESKSPFHRRHQRQDPGDNCHVQVDDFFST